ncbi:MAG: hypothetical protein PHD82_13605 [Candidatus Riflebacteria bacterium]|nr:hypothetical protein [Candidatus Riflebacteria bacterium]
MTDSSTPMNGGRQVAVLPLSLFCWAASFWLLAKIGPGIGMLPENPATFFSAAILTLLSAFVVYGYSRLGLHRSLYLLTGAIGAIAVFYAAQPMVERSKAINLSASLPGEVMFMSAETAGLNFQADKLLIEPRNQLFSAVNREVKLALPEPAALILLLALVQLTLASGIGLWIGEGIDEVSHLIPVALVATLADIWSVSAGATSMIIVSSSINYFLLRFPLPGTSEIPYLIGLTDFLFFAIFFQAAIRFKLGTRKNAILLLASFLITVAAAIFFGVGLPVLPFMAAIFVAGNFRRLELKREEIRQILIFSVVILALFSAVTFFAR